MLPGKTVSRVFVAYIFGYIQNLKKKVEKNLHRTVSLTRVVPLAGYAYCVSSKLHYLRLTTALKVSEV